MTQVRTLWMSFADPDRPKGQQFLGVCVIDVTEGEAAAVKPDLDARFPRHAPGAEWMAAAQTKAWRSGCNPGGAIQFVELPPEDPRVAALPRNHLMSKAELTRRGLV